MNGLARFAARVRRRAHLAPAVSRIAPTSTSAAARTHAQCRPRRRPLPGDRLLERPVFILSSVRSGSTLLRVMLDTHSQLHAPPELHLGQLGVRLNNKYVRRAMDELGMDKRDLEHLLWDRVLHREVTRHGKRYVVNKTPADVFIWQRLVECWPDMRFVYLLRDPGAMVDSWNRARDYWSREETANDILRYVSKIEEARQVRPGVTLRYEDLTEDPERELRRVCAFLDVPWEPAMLRYGDASHGSFRPGLGDWSDRIKSGTVQPARVSDAAAIPEVLRPVAVSWGYLGVEEGTA